MRLHSWYRTIVSGGAESLALWIGSEPSCRSTTYVNNSVGNKPLESIYDYEGRVSKSRPNMTPSTNLGDTILSLLIEEPVVASFFTSFFHIIHL
jgi:hypothetical protein